MANGQHITQVTKSDAASGSIVWARLEQESVPAAADEANLADLYQMLAAATSGRSAFEYVYDSCPYVTIVDGLIAITLAFFVWPSDLTLTYNVYSDVGAVTGPVQCEEPRSFDLPFDSTDVAPLGFIFDGTFVPEMPFILDDGSIAPDPVVTERATEVQLDADLTTVMRAEGVASGFKHDLIIKIQKAEDGETYNIEDLKPVLTLAWEDAEGKVQSDVIEVQIPGCVSDLLTICKDGTLMAGDVGIDADKLFVAYYSTCSGKVIGKGWEDQEK